MRPAYLADLQGLCGSLIDLLRRMIQVCIHLPAPLQAAACLGGLLLVSRGVSPSWPKAPDFDSGIRRFESYHPRHMNFASLTERLMCRTLNPIQLGSTPRRRTNNALVMELADILDSDSRFWGFEAPRGYQSC